MASRPRRMNCEEVLHEMFADRDSDLSEESELESEWDVSESDENNSEPGEKNESERIDEDVNENNGVEPDGGQQRGQKVGRGARGAARGVHGVTRGVRGARRGARGATRGARACGDPQRQAALEAQWVAVDREPDVPSFTGSSGI